MKFNEDIIKDLAFPIIGALLFIAVAFWGIHSIYLTGLNELNKITAAVENIKNPQILSENIDSVQTKTFTLLNIDSDYYLGKGFIEGELYYIFQIKEQVSEKGYEAAPVSSSKLVYDGENIVEVTKVNITQKYKTVDNQVKTREIVKYYYIFHVPNNRVKDYGVIQEKIEYYGNNSMFFFPVFIPFIVK